MVEIKVTNRTVRQPQEDSPGRWANGLRSGRSDTYIVKETDQHEYPGRDAMVMPGGQQSQHACESLRYTAIAAGAQCCDSSPQHYWFALPASTLQKAGRRWALWESERNGIEATNSRYKLMRRPLCPIATQVRHILSLLILVVFVSGRKLDISPSFCVFAGVIRLLVKYFLSSQLVIAPKFSIAVIQITDRTNG